MFRVGQKVVCVNASYTDALGERELHEGNIYTVRWVGVHAFPDEEDDAELCIRLMEVDRGPDPWEPELIDTPFAYWRFRPVVERKTSIEVFTKMLTPNKTTVQA